MRNIPTTTILAGIAVAFATSGAAHADVTISSAATANMTCSNSVCVPTATNAVLNVDDLESLLVSANVEVTTTGSGIQADNIQVDAALDWSSTNTLELDAYQSIRIDEPISVTGTGGLSVATDDGGTGGTFSFGWGGSVSFPGTSNPLSINGLSYALVSTLPALANAVAANPSGAYALAANYDAAQDGKYQTSPIMTTFKGSFNGLGNTVSRVRISDVNQYYTAGLFSELGQSGIVASVRVQGLNLRFKASKTPLVGGLVAENIGKIFNSSVAGQIAVRVNEAGVIGGISGVNSGTVDHTASDVAIQVTSNREGGNNLGGITGINSGIMEQSFASGTVATDGSSGANELGGLAGGNGGTISNCYAMGSATSGDQGVDNIGGLIGINDFDIQSSYSTGAPKGRGVGSYIGGSVGYDASSQENGSIRSTYWDTTTSGIMDLSQGAGNIPNDHGIKGKSTAQLKKSLPKGFDSTIWAEDKDINKGLPYLIDNPPH